MKNLAKLKFKTESQKGKQKPMFAARTARAVPQLRKVAKALTGYKEGGTMTKERLRSAADRLKTYALAKSNVGKDRLTSKDIERAEQLTKGFKGTKEALKLTESESKKKGREKAKKVKKKVKDFGEKASGFFLEIIGRNRGGVIRPKPTFRGKVLKPKPITRRGVGIAIRGFGKAFKKGR